MTKQESAGTCRLCASVCKKVFSGRVLDRHAVTYLLCPTCDLLQTEQPYWLDEAYARPITLQDTGLLSRNIMLSSRLSVFLNDAGLREGRFLDYAGGYGVMTRLMRDIGFDYYWNDLYTQNLFSVGFEGNLDSKYDAVSAFEVLEHLDDPASVVQQVLSSTDTFVFSTELREVGSVPPPDWMYYGFAHGQHVSFFSRATLSYLAERTGTRLLTDGRFFHVLTRLTSPRVLRVNGRLARLRAALVRRRMSSLTVADSRSFD